MICVVAKFVFNAGKINEFMDILHSPDGLAVTRAYKGCQLIEASISRVAIHFICMSVGIAKQTTKIILNIVQIRGCWMY